MGKAARWLRGLWSSGGGGGGRKESRSGGETNEKKRWSFGRSGRSSVDRGSGAEKEWMRNCYMECEKEQSKHAIAVAAATAAAADAAVAAAQAAVAVVRMTSHGCGAVFCGSVEKWAAVKIQSVFRGHLARKALRALKALVKVQALFRGYLVRKQADASLHGMQALIRAQNAVRARRSRVLPVRDHCKFYPESRPRRSLERFDHSRSEHAVSIHSRRLSTTMDSSFNGFDERTKIVEIDPGRPKSRNPRTIINPRSSDSTTEEPEASLRSNTNSSPRFCKLSIRLAIPGSRHLQDPDWCIPGDECRSSTAHNTPRLMFPVTPAKSVGCDGMYRSYQQSQSSHHHHPNYMAKTESFNAKVRSQSAPKQRPDLKKNLSLSEIVESRLSVSSVRMQRSCSQAEEDLGFSKSAIVAGGRIDRSLELGGRRGTTARCRGGGDDLKGMEGGKRNAAAVV